MGLMPLPVRLATLAIILCCLLEERHTDSSG
jgi:hypothetical protein